MEIRIKRGTSEYLSQTNPVLGAGEPCLETDTNKVKYGDGTTPWNLLEYSNGGDVPSFGTNNEATGTDAFVGGGSGNTASGTSAFIGGGENNTASGDRSSVVGGMNNVAEGESSLCLGSDNSSEGECSVAMGLDSKARTTGQIAFSSGKFNIQGDSQASIYSLRAETTDSSPVFMTADGTEYVAVLPGSVFMFTAKVAAYNVTDGTALVSSISGGIKRDLADGMAFVGDPIQDDWSDEGWTGSVQVEAHGESDGQPFALAIKVIGDAGKNIYWTATLTTTELRTKPPLTSDMFVDVTADAQISSLNVTIANSSGSLFPSFNPAIHDYCIYSGSDGTDSYTLTINGNATTGTIDVNKALHVMYGAQEYFIRVLPTDLPMPTLVTKTAGYRPGYYLYETNQSTGTQYFVVFDENLVPVWYIHDDRYGTLPFALLCTVPNKLVLHTQSTPTRCAVELGMNEMTATNYTMQNEETNSNPIWECHESHMVAGPPERAGNFISMTYAYGCGGTYMPRNGLYIQELSADGQTVVWEWYSDDYFNLNGTWDYFHANSIDVNPVTGDLLLSCRHTGGGFCIDYATKDVKWILQGVPIEVGGLFSSVARPGMLTNTKYLTITGDPYSPPQGNHDARWHSDIPPLTPGNQVVSFYDDKTYAGPYARGVVYEIDLNTNQAIFRAHAHSETGTSQQQGGFTLVKELDGSYSHVPTYHEMSPVLVEYNNGTNLDPNQNVVFSVNMFESGNFYRIVKVRPDFLDIDFMRTTAGRPLTFP